MSAAGLAVAPYAYGDWSYRRPAASCPVPPKTALLLMV